MKCKIIAIGLLLLIGCAAVAMADDDYKRHPGYVDFEKMGIFGDMEASVEVILKGSILSMVQQGIGNEDPELSDMIGKLKFIHIQTFPLEKIDVQSLESKMNGVAKQLEKSGWEVVVRVRDKKEDEHVYIYILPTNSDKIVSGLVVMVIKADDEAVFINVVGDLDPAQIGKLGKQFDIDELDSLKIE